MYLSTYFVNDTKKEYTYTGIHTPEQSSKNLRRLESVYKWDLRKDNIFIWHTNRENLIKYRILV